MASSALQRPKQLSPELEAVVGKGPMASTEVMKQLWVYIKAHKLQKPGEGRTIVPDATLAKVLGTGEINMMKMAGKVFEHIKK